MEEALKKLVFKPYQYKSISEETAAGSFFPTGSESLATMSLTN